MTGTRTILFLTLIGFMGARPGVCQSSEPSQPVNISVADLSKGTVSGRVCDTVTGKPVCGAMVALQDKNGKTIAWTYTDETGTYQVGTDMLKALRLEEPRRKGPLEQVAGAVGKVVSAPMKIVGDVARGVIGSAGRIDAGTAAKAALAAGITGNPAPLAAVVINDSRDRNSDTMARSLSPAENAREMRDSLEPGEVVLLVSATGYKPLRGKTSAYWMDPANTHEGVGPQAFLNAAKLAPTAGEAESVIAEESLKLVEPEVTPFLVLPNGVVQIRARVKSPSGRSHSIRVFAREAQKGVFTELLPQADGSYEGSLKLDSEAPDGDTAVCIVAVRPEPVGIKREGMANADSLPDFIRGRDELNPKKAYNYDPRIFAAENRLEIMVTVLDPKKGISARMPK